MKVTTSFEIWAQLMLSAKDCELIREFFLKEIGINPKLVIRNLHLTVYHARRPMPGLMPTIRNINLVLPATDTRYMVLAPGGENPRPELDPRNHKVGIRIKRSSPIIANIRNFRNELLTYETKTVLGKRSASSNKRNAFGSRYFQPHIALLRSGCNIDRDLTRIGTLFRERIGELTFDKFIIDVVPAKPTFK